MRRKAPPAHPLAATLRRTERWAREAAKGAKRDRRRWFFARPALGSCATCRETTGTTILSKHLIAESEPGITALQEEISEIFRRFVAAQNARDEGALAPLLSEGVGFLWVTTSAVTIWGHDAALARFRVNWEKQWHLDPDPDGLRIVEISPEVALPHVPLRFTFAPHGQRAIPAAIQWSGVFRRVEGCWIIAAILLATVL